MKQQTLASGNHPLDVSMPACALCSNHSATGHRHGIRKTTTRCKYSLEDCPRPSLLSSVSRKGRAPQPWSCSTLPTLIIIDARWTLKFTPPPLPPLPTHCTQDSCRKQYCTLDRGHRSHPLRHLVAQYTTYISGTYHTLPTPLPSLCPPVSRSRIA